jgi:uncharacterized protein
MNKTLKSLIDRHPILAYFVLAFGIAWGGCLLFGLPTLLKGETFTMSTALLMFLCMIAGPSISGIVMTRIVDGKPGLDDLFVRMRRWRVGGQWYAAALLIPSGLFLLALLLLSRLVSPIYAPGFSAFGLIIGLLAGFFEETGWMGYAYPKMRAKLTPLMAALLLGVIHAIWHGLADFIGTFGEMGWVWVPYYLVWMLATLTLQRVLISWVYSSTGSILLAQLMHFSSTGFQSALRPVGELSAVTLIVIYGVFVLLNLVVVAIVIARTKRQLVAGPYQGSPG